MRALAVALFFFSLVALSQGYRIAFTVLMTSSAILGIIAKLRF